MLWPLLNVPNELTHCRLSAQESLAQPRPVLFIFKNVIAVQLIYKLISGT